MKLALLNTSILTATGSYKLEEITLRKAVELVNSNEIDSAIGHQASADIMSKLLGISVNVNRQLFKQEIGQQALVFKLKGRPEEGKILSVNEINEIGYSFMLLSRNE